MPRTAIAPLLRAAGVGSGLEPAASRCRLPGLYHRMMRTGCVAVADGVELAVDVWAAEAASAAEAAGPAETGRAPAGDDPRAVSNGHDSPPFLLVHGLASNARMWDGVAERLAARGHVAVTVDLRGHGRSSKPDGPYDVPTVADDLATLIGELKLDRPIVAGQSWGGNVVLELAARRPGAVRGIVCVDGGWLEPSRVFPDWDDCRRALAPPPLAGRPAVEIEAYVRSAHSDWPETGIRGALANFELRDDGTIAPWLTFERHIAVLRGLWEHRPSGRFADVGVPVLLVPVDGGEGDWTARKRADVEAALTALPRASAHWFRGDHDIHAQHPGELTDVIVASTRNGFFG